MRGNIPARPRPSKSLKGAPGQCKHYDGYYIKAAADDVRGAMTKLENSIPKSELDISWTPGETNSKTM